MRGVLYFVENQAFLSVVLVVIALMLAVKVLPGVVLVSVALVRIVDVPGLVAVVLVVVALMLVVQVLSRVMLVLVALVDFVGMCGHFSLLKLYFHCFEITKQYITLLPTIVMYIRQIKIYDT